jgi:4-diphosphocytidyl-2-C-methyl-D-erythritol kinase
MPARRQPAPAKVNLFLHVGRKRTDGYHDLTSLVVFPDVGDVVSISTNAVIPAKARLGREPGPIAGRTRTMKVQHADEWVPVLARRALARDDKLSDRIAFSIKGPFAAALRLEEHNDDEPLPRANAVLDAAVTLKGRMLFRGRMVPGAKIVLTKNLPIASGIGGGSADAAAALRLLNTVWNLRLSKDELREIGLAIGSDVPVCIDPRPQWMEGRGERVERGPRMPEVYMTLVNPGVPVPTAAVFRTLTKKSGSKRPPAPKSFSSARSLSAWLARETRNDLQAPALAIAPPIAHVLEALAAQPGCLLARMSGSGATCFGLFETAREANRAAASMPKTWWAQAGAVS